MKHKKANKKVIDIQNINHYKKREYKKYTNLNQTVHYYAYSTVVNTTTTSLLTSTGHTIKQKNIREKKIVT